MMDLLAGIKERRSIRKYTEQPVTKEAIEKAAEMARFAPSWKNSQTVRYYAVLDPEKKDQIAEDGTLGFSKNKDNIRNAPALVVLTTVKGISGYEADGSFTTTKESHWESFDAGIACQTFCLAAYAQGLGTLIMGIFNEEKIAAILQLPENETVSALIAVGYADQNPDAPARKPLGEILTIL